MAYFVLILKNRSFLVISDEKQKIQNIVCRGNREKTQYMDYIIKALKVKPHVEFARKRVLVFDDATQMSKYWVGTPWIVNMVRTNILANKSFYILLMKKGHKLPIKNLTNFRLKTSQTSDLSLNVLFVCYIIQFKRRSK